MTSYYEQGCHDTLCEGPEFLICGANNVLEHYGKRIEILHSILLRTELTGHGHPMPFLAEISCLTELAMPCWVSPQKDTCADFNSFL